MDSTTTTSVKKRTLTDQEVGKEEDQLSSKSCKVDDDAPNSMPPSPIATTTFHPFPESITLYFDGGAAPNPGICAGGWCVQDSNGKEWAHGWKFVGLNNTNNEGEYHGLLHGLECLLAQQYKGKVHIRGDSMLVIQQSQGKNKCKAPNLQPLLARVLKMVQELKTAKVKVTFEQVPRALNKKADGYANQGKNIQTTEINLMM